MVIENDITKMFGIKLPILNAPMGPFLTNDIAIGVSEAGGLGVVSHSGGLEQLKAARAVSTDDKDFMAKISRAMGGDYVEKSLVYVAEHTDKPFGFNVRTSRVEMDSVRLSKKLPKLIMENPKLREQVVYCVTSAGSPRVFPQSKSFQKLRELGVIKHFHVAPALWLADKCVAAGCDGIVCTGTEGGGHQSYEKVSTLVLLQQVRQKYPDIPILGCGGFGSGEGLAAVLGMGGGGIVMGTRFIASKEAEYHDNYKNIVPPMKAGDTRLVKGGIGPIRIWKNKYCMAREMVTTKEEFTATQDSMSPKEMIEEMMHYVTAVDGDIVDSPILIGQSGGLVSSIEAIGDLVSIIAKDAERLLKSAYSNIK